MVTEGLSQKIDIRLTALFAGETGSPVGRGKIVMSSISRRRFLQAGLAAGIGAQLCVWAGVAKAIDAPAGRYDAIIVGGGTAGVIVATKLRKAGGKHKRILIIEAGGPTAASIGGAAFPPWLPPDRSDLTMFDVPGEYSQMAFTPFGAPYQLTETPFTFQGIGLGGNSQFNGMLFQTNPPQKFDDRWPSGWHWKNIRSHFRSVRQNIPVTNVPSTDGIAQNTGPAMIAHPLYAASGNGWIEADTSQPFTAPCGCSQFRMLCKHWSFAPTALSWPACLRSCPQWFLWSPSGFGVEPPWNLRCWPSGIRWPFSTGSGPVDRGLVELTACRGPGSIELGRAA